MKRSFFPLSHQECICISSIPLDHYIAINLQDNSLRQRVANSVLAVKKRPLKEKEGRRESCYLFRFLKKSIDYF